MKAALTPIEPEEMSRPTMLHIVILTTLISTFGSLIIAILRLGKPRKPESAMRYAGEIADDQQPDGRLVEDGAMEPAGMQPVVIGESAQGQSVQGVSADARATTRWSLPTKYAVGVGLFLAFLFFVYISRSSLGMIIFAGLLAFVVQPLIRFFQRRWKMKRSSAIGLAYLLVVAALILIPLLVIPAIIESINGVLSVDWQSIGQDMAASLQTIAQNASSIPVIGPTIASTLETVAQFLSGAARLPSPAPVVVDVSATSLGGKLADTLGKLVRILGPMISAVVSLLFMLLISLRISLSADEMREAYPKLVPPSYKQEIIELVERIINVWSSFLRGELSLMLIMGVLTYLLNLLLGTPYALFLGFAAGLLEIIPSLGPILATIPAVILALLFGSSHLAVSNLVFALIVILGYILLSALENQVIVPKVLGDAVNLPPLVVIVGVVIFGAAFGLLGVFLATPVISTGKELFGYLYNKILEPPPEIKPPEKRPSLMDTFKGFAQRIRSPFRREKGSV